MLWIRVILFNLSYLFRVVCLGRIVIVSIFFYIAGLLYLKYLVVLIYVRGVVVFILYISCICWYTTNKMPLFVLITGVGSLLLFDLGGFRKFRDIGEFLWMYLYFALLFSNLVNVYSLRLFKVRGSLRF